MLGLAAAWGLGALLLTTGVKAQDGAAQLSQIGQRFIDEALHQPSADAPKGSNGMPLRMEVQMGQLDSRLRLAAPAPRSSLICLLAADSGAAPVWACAACKAASPGMCFCPLTCAPLWPGLVAQGNIRQTLSAEDAAPAEVDWAEDSTPVFANAQDFIGMVAARPLASGQALRQNMVRPPALFTAGFARSGRGLPAELQHFCLRQGDGSSRRRPASAGSHG